MREPSDPGMRLAAFALAWVAGVALHLQQRALWPTAACIAATAAGAIGLGAALIRAPRGRRGVVIGAIVGVIGATLLAFGASGWRASLRLADALPAALEGEDVVATGVITTLPQRSAAGLRFRFEVESASLRGEAVKLPELLAVGWYKGQFEDAALSTPQAELRAGQRWRFALRLRRPHGSLNPYGFDYELNLFEQGVRATAYVRDAPPPELLHRAAGYPVERLRQRVRDAIDASVKDHRAAGVLAALAVGDQGAIEHDDWDLYRNTGIAHLVSISGLHITMFAWLAGLVIAKAWRRSARASLWWPAPIAARWGGLACAAAYAVFSGWGVPSQRTVWMLATVTLLQTLGLRWPWLLVLLAGAVIVTAIDPWALMQAGFWLSFVAVGLLMASSTRDPTRPGVVREGRWWRRAGRAVWHAAREDLRTQVIATIGLAPLTLVFFQQLSLVGFAANLIAIPLITIVITPLALLGIGLVPLWTLGAAAVQLLNAALGWLAHWPGAVWIAPVAPLWAQLAGLLGALLMVLPLPWRARLFALPLVLPLILPPRALPAPGEFDLIALDIGQGTSVLVRTRDHTLVFDAGPQYSRESDAGERVLLPLLRARGETKLDRLVLSHRDLDHVGGAAAVIKGLPVDDVLSSLELEHPILALAAHTTRCQAGQSWVWDGVHFDLLRPPAEDYERTLKSNAMSCVLRVSSGAGTAAARSVLLTGDIEKEQEAALIASAPEALPSSVLIVPHHGSRTSSTAAFLDAVRPKVAVFQAGYRNRFGHPAPDVMARYLARGIEVRVSPACGAWLWDARGAPGGLCYRDIARRYWHDDGGFPPPGTPRRGPL
jgi:competence protein ComEC